jgi:hypothetical protein
MRRANLADAAGACSSVGAKIAAEAAITKRRIADFRNCGRDPIRWTCQALANQPPIRQMAIFRAIPSSGRVFQEDFREETH